MKNPVLTLTEDTFAATCEAEAIQAAATKDETYWALLEAHSALLRA